jgi:small subunit ribosomal protein S9
LSEGTGKVTVNNKDYKEYFPTGILQYIVLQPLNLLELANKYDVKVNLDGGGITGQAEATRLGITRALIQINEESRGKLRSAGFVTRDPREVERKKPGQKKARKKFQFSKR